MEKRCTKCGQVKLLAEFDRHGREAFCKACRRKMRNAKYVPHPKPRHSVEKGQRFGRLAVLEEAPPRNGSRRVACLCDCGNEVTTMLQSLLKGETTSCGCYHRETLAEINRSAEHRASAITHGLTQHPLLGTWRGMMARCENPDHHAFKNYGGRGITVCPEWHDVAVFITWIEANIGPRPAGRTLDRANNDRRYEPGNVRWATRSEQQRNRRSKEQCDADAARYAAAGTQRVNSR